MARRVKFDAGFARKRAGARRKRKVDTRSIRKFYLIVCEGEKTEPLYFEGLRDALPAGVLSVTNIDIEGTGKNTRSIIKHARKYAESLEKQYLRTIDFIWAVFDRDSFPANDFNSAISSGENGKPKVHCAWTNEAFELWYLLHFQFRNTGISRDHYKEKIEKAVESASGKKGFSYQKNDPAMFAVLEEYGDQKMAIRFAEKLEKIYQDGNYAGHNPCTKVHVLVRELNLLKED